MQYFTLPHTVLQTLADSGRLWWTCIVDKLKLNVQREFETMTSHFKIVGSLN